MSNGASSDGRPLVDIGWILVQPLEAPDRKAAERAAERCRAFLEEQFPETAFQITTVGPRDFGFAQRVNVVSTLELGALEREVRRWDFVFVVTGSDLDSQYLPYAFGASARSLAAAMASTFRIDPDFAEANVGEEERAERISRRIVVLFLKAFGLLNGLGVNDKEKTVMGPTYRVDQLDRTPVFDPGQTARLKEALEAVSDPRVEESNGAAVGTLAFYIQTIRAHPAAILGAVRQAEPWLLPFRLSRLTAAAFSALLLLMITAEVWELGLTQTLSTMLTTTGVAWLGTTVYVMRRQQLGTHRSGVRLIEHTVQNQISMALVISLGMAASWALLFGTSLVLGLGLFPGGLLTGWAPSLGHKVLLEDRLVFSGIVAALGLVVGALGASFEDQDYFRHVAEVDLEF